MINSIELENFQIHKNKKLIFSPGINVITGSSNNGKSAIVKAINWVVNGEPSGNSVINYEEEKCSVVINIDGRNIQKIKSQKINQYIIDGKKLKSVGQTVPEEIATITKFSPLNLQMQFDDFFLLQDSPGEVARKLNKIIDLSIIDHSIKKAKNKVRNKKQEIDTLQASTISLKKQIKKYKDLDKIEILVNKLYALLDKQEEILFCYNALLELKERNNYYILQLQKFSNLAILERNIKKMKRKSNSYILLIDTIQKLQQIKKQHTEHTNIIQKFVNNISVIKKIKKIKKMLEKYEKSSIIVSIYDEYKINIQTIRDLENQIYLFDKKKSLILPKGSICPLCKKLI